MADRFCGPLFVAAAGHPQGFRRFREIPARFCKVSQGFRKISLLEMFFGNHTEKP
ncbi:MAG: hypothetical protein IJL60_01340 [Clostridiales bacterium]|nr:hypothetical protein [Clostridiales bacterium]